MTAQLASFEGSVPTAPMGEETNPHYLHSSWPQPLLVALDPILPLLLDELVTDIAVNGYKEVWAKRAGTKGYVRVPEAGWDDQPSFLNACTRISEVVERRISDEVPLLDGRLPGAERVNIVVPPACDRGSLTIRKFPRKPMTLDRLQALGTLSPALRQLCEALVLARVSILVAGSTGAGKTSLLNALSLVIPEGERIITVEDACELQIQQPNVVRLETVLPIDDRVTPITIGTLVKNSLRQNPDRIIVGEVRGAEAFDLIRALSTGHSGGFGTIHANSATDALHILQLLAQMAEVRGLTAPAVAGLVARAIDVVIFQEQHDDGVRRISQIIELHGDRISIGPTGDFSYVARTIARWDRKARDWVFPEAPSSGVRAWIENLGPVLPPSDASSVIALDIDSRDLSQTSAIPITDSTEDEEEDTRKQ